jgi:hypothetical protein
MLLYEDWNIGEGTESVDFYAGAIKWIRFELMMAYTRFSYLLNLIRDIARMLLAVIISL